MKLSGVPAAQILSIGLMSAANAGKETRCAGYLLLLTAVFITRSVPVAHTLSLFCFSLTTFECPGVAGTLCFREAGRELSRILFSKGYRFSGMMRNEDFFVLEKSSGVTRSKIFATLPGYPNYNRTVLPVYKKCRDFL
jgi:hypothetical protein